MRCRSSLAAFKSSLRWFQSRLISRSFCKPLLSSRTSQTTNATTARAIFQLSGIQSGMAVAPLLHPTVSKALCHRAERLIIVIVTATIVDRRQLRPRCWVLCRYNRLNDLVPRSRLRNSRLVARPSSRRVLGFWHFFIVPVDAKRWADHLIFGRLGARVYAHFASPLWSLCCKPPFSIYQVSSRYAKDLCHRRVCTTPNMIQRRLQSDRGSCDGLLCGCFWPSCERLWRCFCECVFPMT